MRPLTHRMTAACAAALLLSLAGCGGGGGSGGSFALPLGSAPAPETPAATARLSGVAATGAAFDGATITVIDQTGATVCTTETDSAGAYACDLPASTRAPLVIRAQREDQVLYSTTASAEGGVTNVTPLTTIVVAQLSPEGNPARLAGALQSNPGAVTEAGIQAQVAELLAALQPLLAALGESFDPMSGVFAADGTGQDRVLDAISVSVRPDGTAANIEITVKALPAAADDPPLKIGFRTDGPSIPTLPWVSREQLARIPTPAMVASLLERLNACYALPLTQRVNTAANDNANAVGGPQNVVAPACRTLFVDDDPATYVANGASVGRDASNRGAFSSLFRSGPTNLRHDRGNFEFFRQDGGVVLTYRWTDVLGNTDNDTIVARDAGGTLKLTGNSNLYRASVRAYAENREMINSPAYSSYNTGYHINIDNRLNGSGMPVLEKVEVTTPMDTVLTYVPQPGLSYLVLSRDGSPATATADGVLRLAGAYQDLATPGAPSDTETGLYYVGTQLTEAQLRDLGDQSVWKLEFFPVNGDRTVQAYRTIARAPTLGELRLQSFAHLTPALQAELVAEGASPEAVGGVTAFGPAGQGDPNNIDVSAAGETDGWAVPSGALAPTMVSAFGRAPRISPTVRGARYNDSITVRNAARTAVLWCTPQSPTDAHCDGSFAGQYAWGATVSVLELWARSARQVELSKKIGLYKLPE